MIDILNSFFSHSNECLQIEGQWIMPERKIRIALIEDSKTVRAFYQMVFEESGFDVIEAENAKDGWKVICDSKPDVVVLDMMLPDIPGLELLKRIRMIDSVKNLPVIALTAVKDIKYVQEVIKAGANYYSVKGSDSPKKIQGMIYKLLKNTRDEKITRSIGDHGAANQGSQEENSVDDIHRYFWYH